MRQNLATKRSRGKQIIYRYNGDPRSDEVVSDKTGAMPFRRVGEELTRKGKVWRVAVVRDDLNMAGSAIAIPLHRVFLTDKL
jgi:hypothetical protein